MPPPPLLLPPRLEPSLQATTAPRPTFEPPLRSTLRSWTEDRALPREIGWRTCWARIKAEVSLRVSRVAFSSTAVLYSRSNNLCNLLRCILPPLVRHTRFISSLQNLISPAVDECNSLLWGVDVVDLEHCTAGWADAFASSAVFRSLRPAAIFERLTAGASLSFAAGIQVLDVLPGPSIRLREDRTHRSLVSDVDDRLSAPTSLPSSRLFGWQ